VRGSLDVDAGLNQNPVRCRVLCMGYEMQELQKLKAQHSEQPSPVPFAG
jgi:hypothetical protein